MGSKGRRIFNPPPPPNALGEGGAINRGMNYSGGNAEPVGQTYSPFGDFSQSYNGSSTNQPPYNPNSGMNGSLKIGTGTGTGNFFQPYSPFFTRF